MKNRSLYPSIMAHSGDKKKSQEFNDLQVYIKNQILDNRIISEKKGAITLGESPCITDGETLMQYSRQTR